MCLFLLSVLVSHDQSSGSGSGDDAIIVKGNKFPYLVLILINQLNHTSHMISLLRHTIIVLPLAMTSAVLHLCVLLFQNYLIVLVFPH